MSRAPVRPRLAGEEGSALIVVLALSGILSILIGASFVLARQSIRVADAEEEVHGALAAAEAGLDDYLFRLNSVDQYWEYGAAADGLPAPPDGNGAFDGFVPVPGGPSQSDFTYAVDTSRFASERVLVVESTGRTDDGRERTIAATLKQDSFLDYLWFTDLETLSPVLYAAGDQTWAETNCTTRRWEQERATSGRPSNPADGCRDIYWIGGDVVDGPFHTNDRFRIGGNASWLGPASSSDPAVPPYDSTGAAVPTFAVAGDPRYRAPLEMPPTNLALRTEADPATAGEGCLYTGPTQIVLRADGLMEVTSPYTRTSGAGCGSWTDGDDGTQTVPIPANGVVYVQAVPADPADPNHSSGCTAGNGNGLGYPWGDDVWTYECTAGDAFVEGTVDGRLTIGAEHDVIITWHVDYEAADDMLGLIAGDHVAIYHPVTCTSTAGDGSCAAWGNATAGPRHPGSTFADARLDAAVLALQGSFMVQTWDNRRSGGQPCGALGTLEVTGAIAQRFRGPVGTFSGGGTPCTGYLKDYVYDSRLRTSNPPSFIDPVQGRWEAIRVGEIFPTNP